jgi:hypothetical protein
MKGYVYKTFIQGLIAGCCLSSGFFSSSSTSASCYSDLRPFRMRNIETARSEMVPAWFLIRSYQSFHWKFETCCVFLRKRKQSRALKTQNKRTPPSKTYVMRQFNSRNLPCELKILFLCTTRLLSPSKCSPCEAVHFVSYWLHCRKQVLKIVFRNTSR